MGQNLISDPELCHAALQQVLQSQAFSRSEQSRNFLKYVCEKTVVGRAGDIKEYSIGVEALGRHPSYSPADDSSVRRRAYEIRQRLEEFYSTEMPDAEVRIELPKGSYVPLFVRQDPDPPPPETALENVPAPIARVVEHRPKSYTILAFVLGGLLGAGLLLVGRGWPASSPQLDPIVREFWGPLLDPQSRTLICLGSTLHMQVRAAPFADHPETKYPAPERLYPVYEQGRPLPPGARLYMRPVENAAPIGVVAGVAIATGTMRLAGASFQILPERTAPLASFRGRNVILFGDALSSLAGAKELDRAYLTVAYDEAGTRLVIRDRRKPATDPPVFSRKQESSAGTLEAYGLITVLPTEESSPARERTFIISAVSSAGMHGAMEFLASPERLRNLKERFLHQGLKGIPNAYQVVVKCRASSSLLMSYEYASHEVIDPKVTAGLR